MSGVKVPQNATFVSIYGDNIQNNGGPTEKTVSPGVLIVSYQVPPGMELWVKAVSLIPNPNAQSYGVGFISYGDATLGPTDGIILSQAVQDIWDYELVIRQGQFLKIGIYSTNPSQAVGGSASFNGALLPAGTKASLR